MRALGTRVGRRAWPTRNARTSRPARSGNDTRRRLLGPGLVALVFAASLLAPWPQGAAGDAEAFVHSPAPAPGALVPAGETTLQAWLWAPAGVADVAVKIDGEAVDEVALGGHVRDRGTELRAQVELTPGARTVQVTLRDAVGGEVERAWQLTATHRTVRRLAGATRIDTAVALSQEAYRDTGAEAAVLARADDFADALAGGPLAAAVEGPLLLTASRSLSQASAAELQRVLADGATVHLLGGPAALDEDVRRAVEALGFTTVRHAGVDRYATAAAVAAQLHAAAGVLLASGRSFPDALAASAPAARDGVPVLLVDGDRLPEATATAIADADPPLVTIVGGPAAVGNDVEREVRGLVDDVARVAGEDRYATAVAVAEAFYDEPEAVALASGVAFPDALAGARHAAAQGRPLLLSGRVTLPAATDEALRRARPEHIDVYGGPAAIGETVERAALGAAEDGTAGARLRSAVPGADQTVPTLAEVTVELDRDIVVDATSLYVELGGVELRGRLHRPAPGTLAFEVDERQAAPALDVAHPARLVLRVRDADGHTAHHETAFTYLRPDPVFATAGPIELHLPSRNVEVVGYHEANHDGAQQQAPRGTATPTLVLPSRNRGTGSHTSADVVADPEHEVLAPVTGEVVRAGSYVLYCDYSDNFVVINPDARPGWEVKVLHFHGLRVGVGDRVAADDTVIGDGPRQLPFRSQVDAYTEPRDWPHLHVEVVDPSIPTRPGRPC